MRASQARVLSHLLKGAALGRRVRDETDDTIMPAAASNDADTRQGAASRSGLQPQAKRKKTNSRETAFGVEHLRTFGLTVTQRESKTGKIASVACRFSFNFGRELRAGASESAAAGKKSNTRPRQL
jgi:hypothetical protein